MKSKSLKFWIGVLGHRSPRAREAAAYYLGNCGPRAIAALPDLVVLLADEHADVRSMAAYAIFEIGLADHKVIPDFLDKLFDGRVEVRRAAVAAVAFRRVASLSCVGAVVAALGDTDPSVRERAVEALAKVESGFVRSALELPMAAKRYPWAKDADQLLQRLQKFRSRMDVGGIEPTYLFSAESDERVRRGMVLIGALCDQSSTSLLVQAMQDKDTGVRQIAALCAEKLVVCADLIASLTALLRDNESCVRTAALWSLSEWGTRVPAVAQLVSASLDDADSVVRLVAIRALARIEDCPAACVPRLVAWLSDSSAAFRAAAAEALYFSREHPPEMLSRLIDCLRDGEDNVRTAAQTTLSGHSDRLVENLPVCEKLWPLVDSRDPSVCLAAVHVLARLAPFTDLAIPPLMQALRNKFPKVRQKAIGSFGVLGANRADITIEAARLALRDKDSGVREEAAHLLKRLGPVAVPASEELIRCLKDSDSEVRWAAATALAHIDPSRPEPRPVLEELSLCAPNEEIRRLCRNALELLKHDGNARSPVNDQ